MTLRTCEGGGLAFLWTTLYQRRRGGGMGICIHIIFFCLAYRNLKKNQNLGLNIFDFEEI